MKSKFALRRGDWVFIDAPSGDDNSEPDWFKAVRGYVPHNCPGELYDLRHDLSQRLNRYAEHPHLVRDMQQRLERVKLGCDQSVGGENQ